MNKIKSIAEIDKTDLKTIFEVDASVIEITMQCNPELKRPTKFTIKLEESGELISACTWDYGLQPILALAVNDMNVYSFKAKANVYNNELNLTVMSGFKTDKVSAKKVGKISVDQEEIKNQVFEIVDRCIENATLKEIVTRILNMPDMFVKPAAKRCHHGFPGGLGLHILGGLRICYSLYKIYKDYVSLEMLIAGYAIHDCGKVIEYTNDGEISDEGDFTGHIPYGIAILTSVITDMGLSVTDPIAVQLISYISSHHKTLEHGSPSTPATLEAVLIAYADEIDAGMQGAIESLANIPVGGRTAMPVKSLDTYLVKVKNDDMLKEH